MPEPTTTVVDGIETTLPAEAVADLQPKAPEPAPVPAKPEEGTPATPTAVEPQPGAPKAPEPAPEGSPPPVRSRKAGPIADLLAKNHEERSAREAAEKRIAELETKLSSISQTPASPQATDKIKAIAEQYGLEPQVLSDIVALARDGFNPNPTLPKEVADLIAENNLRKAQEAETAAFNKRFDSLASAMPTEPIKEHKDKLMALAYSDKTDPVSGERYADMELAEIYFRAIKPEVEPGKASGEATPTAGTRAAAPVLDYEDILNDDAKMEEFAQNASSEEWTKFTTWRDKRQGDTPIRKAPRN